MNKLSYNTYQFLGNPERITWHWTGGSYTPSSLDAEHYQFLIAFEDGKARVYEGTYSVAGQDHTASDYAAHTKGFNTKNIGIAVCGMHGAVENGTYGNFPITREQIEAMIGLSAFLCRGYAIGTREKYLASHCEIERIHGKVQWGKWDISCVEWDARSWSALNTYFRERVAQALLANVAQGQLAEVGAPMFHIEYNDPNQLIKITVPNKEQVIIVEKPI